MTTWHKFTEKVSSTFVDVDKLEYIQVLMVALGLASLDIVDVLGHDCPFRDGEDYGDCPNGEHGAACWMAYYIDGAGETMDMAKEIEDDDRTDIDHNDN